MEKETDRGFPSQPKVIQELNDDFTDKELIWEKTNNDDKLI